MEPRSRKTQEQRKPTLEPHETCSLQEDEWILWGQFRQISARLRLITMGYATGVSMAGSIWGREWRRNGGVMVTLAIEGSLVHITFFFTGVVIQRRGSTYPTPSRGLSETTTTFTNMSILPTSNRWVERRLRRPPICPRWWSRRREMAIQN